MTKGELFKKLEGFPDDTPILFNFMGRDDYQADTFIARVMADSWLCKGYEECKHTGPEMAYEIVIFVCENKEVEKQYFGTDDEPTENV